MKETILLLRQIHLRIIDRKIKEKKDEINKLYKELLELQIERDEAKK